MVIRSEPEGVITWVSSHRRWSSPSAIPGSVLITGAYFKDSVVSRGDAGGLGELDALSMAHAAAPG